MTCPHHSPLVLTFHVPVLLDLSTPPFSIPITLPVTIYPLKLYLSMPSSPLFSGILYPLILLNSFCQQKDLGYLQQWLKAFVGVFEKTISLSSLEPRR